MNRLLALGIGLVLLSGCGLSSYRTGSRYKPEDLTEISTDSISPYSNYENVWHATLAVMERNYSVAKADKESGRIVSHPEFYRASMMYLKDQAFATIRRDGDLFMPEIKVVTFTDTSTEDSFSSRPSQRRWRQILESTKRAAQLESDVRRILLPPKDKRARSKRSRTGAEGVKPSRRGPNT